MQHALPLYGRGIRPDGADERAGGRRRWATQKRPRASYPSCSDRERQAPLDRGAPTPEVFGARFAEPAKRAGPMGTRPPMGRRAP
eukprot:11196833-Lingulodinium_polyedra.AAC.1